MAIEVLKLRVKARTQPTIDRALEEMRRLKHPQLLPDHIFLAALKSPLADKLIGKERVSQLTRDIETWIIPPRVDSSCNVHSDAFEYFKQAEEVANKRPSKTGHRLPGDRELLTASFNLRSLVPGLMFANREIVDILRIKLQPSHYLAA